MFCDVFNQKQAMKLIEGKKIWFLGSSNMRAIYKDLIWLISRGNIAPETVFKTKNERSYLNDKRISNDILHNGRNYKEIREFKNGNTHLYFQFLTRLFLRDFTELINGINDKNYPDVIFLNSGIWDLTRWGPNGAKNFRQNLLKTLKFLQTKLTTKTRVIWKTTLPVSVNANGALIVDEIKYIVPLLPWHILESNNYASFCVNYFNFDVLDVHHYMRLQGQFHVKDGIHWTPVANRYLTNIFLTHIALCWEKPLPGNFSPTQTFLTDTAKQSLEPEKLKQRLASNKFFFEKLDKKPEEIVRRQDLMHGIKNTILKPNTKHIKETKNKLKHVANRMNNHNNNNYHHLSSALSNMDRIAFTHHRKPTSRIRRNNNIRRGNQFQNNYYHRSNNNYNNQINQRFDYFAPDNYRQYNNLRDFHNDNYFNNHDNPYKNYKW